jgi:hypothetical protein
MTSTRRSFLAAIAALPATAALPKFALGQDVATPGVDAEGAVALLADLGFTEVALEVSDEGLQVPAGLAAGGVLLNGTNTSSAYASILFVQPAEGVTEADIEAALDPDAGIPEWLHTSVVTGSVELEPGGAMSVGFNLTPGEWYIVNAGDVPSFIKVTATGEADAVDPPVDLEVVFNHHRFELPAEVSAGPAVVKVTNDEAVLHHMMLFAYPEPMDSDQFLALLLASEGGPAAATPVPGGLDPMLLEFREGTGMLSQGQSNWLVFNFEPGYYGAACFLSDPGSEIPHAAGGMVATFTVA